MAQIILSNGAAAATPAAGTVTVYSKTADKLLYYKDEAGVEHNITQGSSTQTFSVAPATAAAHAVQLQMVGLFPTVASAATLDIFGAAGATISIDNSTPVTTTSFTACTSAQVGSVKRVIPVQNWSITASANLVVDGATSGTFVMPAGAKLEVLASTTTLFQLTTISASGLWTPNQGAGLTVVGAFSSSGTFKKVGAQVTLNYTLTGATTIAVSAFGVMTSNAPFPVSASGIYTPGDSFVPATGIMYKSYISPSGSSISNAGTAIPAGSAISGQIIYNVYP